MVLTQAAFNQKAMRSKVKRFGKEKYFWGGKKS